MPARSHDHLWKDVIWAFFADFMEMFAPHVARGIDMSSVRLADKEVFTDVAAGRQRTPDIVVEARTKDGQTELILIHVEVQRRRAADVAARMWEYYALLRLRHSVPVYPIVLYLSPGTGGITFEQYDESLFGDTLSTFRYLAIGLPDLSADDYVEAESPLGPAVASLMRAPEGSRVGRLLRVIERLGSARLDEARRWLLGQVVGVYARLTAEEEMQMRSTISRRTGAGAHRLVTLWEKWGLEKGIEQGIERGIEQGIEQGVSEGLVRGQRRSLRSVLTTRFGDLPTTVLDRIDAITDTEALDALMAQAARAATLDEVALG